MSLSFLFICPKYDILLLVQQANEYSKKINIKLVVVVVVMVVVVMIADCISHQCNSLYMLLL
jgi:hypothetical protein